MCLLIFPALLIYYIDIKLSPQLSVFPSLPFLRLPSTVWCPLWLGCTFMFPPQSYSLSPAINNTFDTCFRHGDTQSWLSSTSSCSALAAGSPVQSQNCLWFLLVLPALTLNHPSSLQKCLCFCHFFLHLLPFSALKSRHGYIKSLLPGILTLISNCLTHPAHSSLFNFLTFLSHLTAHLKKLDFWLLCILHPPGIGIHET